MADDETHEPADDEEVSTEEKIQIAQHFLLNAPPGQFGAVLADVKTVSGGVVTDEKLAEIAHDFNVKNLRVLKDGDKPPIVLSKLGEVGGDPTQYWEPCANVVYTVDHVAMQVVGGAVAGQGPPASPHEATRAALQTAVSAYVADRYAEGSAAAVYASAAAAPNELQVAVSGEKVNLRNFWSGQFGSTWVVSLGPEGAAAVNVAGEIKVRAHYFEEGNVQLQTKKTLHAVPLHVAGGGVSAAAAVAQAVADHIAAEERLLQEGLEEMYVNMTDETFKAMRRVMPVHRNKMNWNIHEVKLNQNLRK